jgi:pyruvate carboxylase
MPGVIASVAIKDGQPVQAGDLLLTIEAMKMETGLYADKAGTVKALHVQPGAQVDAKDLLVELEAAA